jgi:hypothetical protein
VVAREVRSPELAIRTKLWVVVMQAGTLREEPVRSADAGRLFIRKPISELGYT